LLHNVATVSAVDCNQAAEKMKMNPPPGEAGEIFI